MRAFLILERHLLLGVLPSKLLLQVKLTETMVTTSWASRVQQLNRVSPVIPILIVL